VIGQLTRQRKRLGGPTVRRGRGDPKKEENLPLQRNNNKDPSGGKKEEKRKISKKQGGGGKRKKKRDPFR